MQGIIFTLFADMVVEKFGMETWNDVLASAAVPSSGVYTTGRAYEDGEMHALLQALCRRIQLDVESAMRAFGQYLFPHLMASLPAGQTCATTFPELLQSIESVIHSEVRRLNPEANPPTIRCRHLEPDLIALHYRSYRDLCCVCEGILQGAAAHYGLRITTRHTLCRHRGDDECVFEIRGVAA